jgi:hypothetical protein
MHTGGPIMMMRTIPAALAGEARSSLEGLAAKVKRTSEPPHSHHAVLPKKSRPERVAGCTHLYGVITLLSVRQTMCAGGA